MTSSSPPAKRSRTNNDDTNIHEEEENSAKLKKTLSPSNDDESNNKNNTSIQLLNNVISSNIIDEQQSSTTTEMLATSYRNAKPYPHGMIYNFCKEGFLEEILTELKHNSKVKFKETDLFRVYQSIDLGNLQPNSELATKMPSIMKLKDAIYSQQYRSFIEQITNLPPNTLTNEVDCAANCHSKGCHLLCHDDVIGTRKVSYIIYLTDPEPKWKEADGGRLELYDAVEEGREEKGSNSSGGAKKGDDDGAGKARYVPSALPSKTILPEFNSMAYFVVQPGVSFHSVQEVFCDRPRLSLQGWYHAKEVPEEMNNATLSRLKSTDRGEDTEGEFKPLAVAEGPSTAAASSTSEAVASSRKSDDSEAANSLSEHDRTFLGKYINAAYLNPKSMNEIQRRFENESSVQLRHFLLDEWNDKIKTALVKEDERDKLSKDRPALDYHVGTNTKDDCKWKVVGPAHEQRFLQFDDDEESNDDDDLVVVCKNDNNDDDNGSNVNLGTGEYLHHLRHKVFQSAEFGRWLGWISSLGFPLGQRGRIRRFRPGLDYTVAHYGVLTTNAVLDATLCFCAGEGKQCRFDDETNELIGSDDDAIWESGDVGGFECYIAADESGEDEGPDAEYDDEDDTKLLSVSASNNTLSLVYRDPGTMRFVKYVGSGAPSSRFDIALEYDVDAEEEDDDLDDNSVDDDEKAEYTEEMKF